MPDTTSPPMPDRILSRIEAAQMLGVSDRTLDRMTGLPKVRLSPGRVGFPLSGIHRWVAAHTISPNAA